MMTQKRAALQPTGGRSRNSAGVLRAYLTLQKRERTAGIAARNQEERHGSLETTDGHMKVGRGSPTLNRGEHTQCRSPTVHGRGLQTSGGGEWKVGGEPQDVELRDGLQTPGGMKGTWRDGGPKGSKDSLPILGNTPTEQCQDLLRPPAAKEGLTVYDDIQHIANKGCRSPGED